MTCCPLKIIAQVPIWAILGSHRTLLIPMMLLYHGHGHNQTGISPQGWGKKLLCSIYEEMLQRDLWGMKKPAEVSNVISHPFQHAFIFLWGGVITEPVLRDEESCCRYQRKKHPCLEPNTEIIPVQGCARGICLLWRSPLFWTQFSHHCQKQLLLYGLLEIIQREWVMLYFCKTHIHI